MELSFVIFIVLFAIGLGVYLARDEGCSAGISTDGDVDANDTCDGDARLQKRQDRLDKILVFLKEKEGDKVTNNDIENLLSVSDATATRYLDELEEEGKVRQVGTVGKGVYYIAA